MIRNLELAFIKLHILYHADIEEVFGVGLMEELGRHGYKVGPGTLYPTLAKMEREDLLTCDARVVDHKQRKYYRTTLQGRAVLSDMKRKIKELYKEVVQEL